MCGYVYDMPAISAPIAEPPIYIPPTTPVPEPAAWLMMLAGLGVVGVARLLRRRANV